MGVVCHVCYVCYVVCHVQIIATNATHVTKGAPVGTVKYMAPETIYQGSAAKNLQLRFGADVWSLGILLWELVYLESPWDEFFEQGNLQQVGRGFAAGGTRVCSTVGRVLAARGTRFCSTWDDRFFEQGNLRKCHLQLILL